MLLMLLLLRRCAAKPGGAGGHGLLLTWVYIDSVTPRSGFPARRPGSRHARASSTPGSCDAATAGTARAAQAHRWLRTPPQQSLASLLMSPISLVKLSQRALVRPLPGPQVPCGARPGDGR